MKGKTVFVFLFLLLPAALAAQTSIREQLLAIKGITLIEDVHPGFREYYSITIEQPLDHFSSGSKTFRQRIFLGFNDSKAPTVLQTEGYSLSGIDQPQFIAGCNVIAIEHRFYGESLPDSMNWTFLTIKQAAADCHHIREVFAPLFKGTWMSTGISKGGQTAVACKMYYPQDVDATLAYVAPIKNGINDSRLGDFMKAAAKTENGKAVFAYQLYWFRHKPELLRFFNDYVTEKKYSFAPLDNETVLDYMLLEFPFSYLQRGMTPDNLPDTSAWPMQAVYTLAYAIPPRLYCAAYRAQQEPSYYMFYHELGYYEYDPAPFKQWLKNDSYPNNIFAPAEADLHFDTTYLMQLNRFIRNPKTERIIFIYGENDPYSALKADVSANKNCLELVVKNGSHKSRIADLSAEQKEQVYGRLSEWLQWDVGN